MTTYSVTRAVGRRVELPVLVDPVSFSPRYDLDRVQGKFSRDGHPLRGAALAGHILASPGVQGGVAGGWAFLAMSSLGVGPGALLFGEVNPVMVQGAVTAGLTIASGVELRFFDDVPTGAIVVIDPDRLVVEVREQTG